MDELKKLFEAIADEKTRNLKLQEEEVLKQVEKTQRKRAHKEQVKEDFWGVFKSELKMLSQQEEETKDKLGRLKEIKEQFEETTPHLYKEIEEVSAPEETPDFFKNIDPEKLSKEFDIRPVSQMVESVEEKEPYKLKEVPQSHTESDWPEELLAHHLPPDMGTKQPDQPDISSLEAKVDALEKKYAGVVEEEVIQEEAQPESFNVTKDAYSAVMDVLSLKPVEKKDKEERKLQELAVQYLSEKKQIVKEQVDETANVQKQIADINANVRQLILGMQGIGGGGEVRLEFLDDIDRATAKVNNKFLMYDSTIQKWKGVDAHEESGLDRVTSHVIPSADDTYDLGTSSLRWRDLYVSGSTVDIGGMKLTNDGSNNLEVKDSGGAKKTISANIAFSDISSKPTTVAGYGISDAVSSSAIANFITLSSISIGSNASASGSGGIAYNNSNGQFTYTPPAIDNFITLTSISMASNASASGTGGVAYNNSNGQFTYTPPDLSTYATLASPALTGAPTAPTATTGSNDTKIATTAFVQQEITALKALLYAYNQS